MVKKAPNETDILVGARVRVRRMQLGLSQSSLGGQVGVTFQQIQKYEKGFNRIGASRLLEIAGVLDVPVAYFFSDEFGSKEEPARAAEVLELLGTHDALELLRDFASISDRAARKALCVIAKALAAGQAPSASAPIPPPN